MALLIASFAGLLDYSNDLLKWVIGASQKLVGVVKSENMCIVYNPLSCLPE